MRNILTVLLLVGAALGQGAYFAGTAQTTSRVTLAYTPITAASVYVCSGVYAGTACTVTNATTVYSNQNLTVVATQPISADAQGNFNFWATPGVYFYTVSGVNATTASYTVTLSAGVNGTNDLAAQSIEQVRYADQFPGADAGAKISACLAALGSAGGICDATAFVGNQSISENMFAGAAGPFVLRLGGAATYTVSATQTISQYGLVVGGTHGQAVLNFTSAASPAIVFDYPFDTGLGQQVQTGLHNLTILGPGSSAGTTAIQLGHIGAGSTGAAGTEIAQCVIRTFGTAISFANNAFYDTVSHTFFDGNGTNISFPAGLTNSGENITLANDFLADAVTASLSVTGAGGEIFVAHSSFDQTAAPISLSADSFVSVSDSHFENSTTAPYVSASAGVIKISGSYFLNDGTTTVPEYVALSGTALGSFIGNRVIGGNATVTIFATLAGSANATQLGNIFESGVTNKFSVAQNVFDAGAICSAAGLANIPPGVISCWNQASQGEADFFDQGDGGSGPFGFNFYSGTGSPTFLGSITTSGLRWGGGSYIASSNNVAMTAQMPLSGTTASIGGSALAAGTCTTGTAAVANSTTAMAVAVSPAADPGTGFAWEGWVSAAGTVTVRLCNITAGSLTPTAEAYNVRVVQ